MTSTKLLAVLLAGLLVTAGAGSVAAVDATATAANEPTDTPTGDDPADDSETSLDLTVDASLDNGSVDLTVTDNGTGIENVSVATDAGQVGETDANGSLTFETNASEELELALAGDNWSAEYAYTIENESLVLAESEVELEGEDESADEGQKGPDENASETAHTVWGTIQEWLENNREGKLGQLIQEALGHGNGNGQADDHRPAHAGENTDDDDGDATGENADDDGDAADDEKPDHAGKKSATERDEKPGKQDDRSKGKQKGHAKGHDSQNAQTDDSDDDDSDDDSDDDDHEDDNRDDDHKDDNRDDDGDEDDDDSDE